MCITYRASRSSWREERALQTVASRFSSVVDFNTNDRTCRARTERPVANASTSPLAACSVRL